MNGGDDKTRLQRLISKLANRGFSAQISETEIRGFHSAAMEIYSRNGEILEADNADFGQALDMLLAEALRDREPGVNTRRAYLERMLSGLTNRL